MMMLDPRLWCLLAFWAGAWLLNSELSKCRAAWVRYAVPLVFGLTVLVLWQAGVTAYGVNKIILPPPSDVLARMSASVPTLWADLVQTFFKGALSGYAIG